MVLRSSGSVTDRPWGQTLAELGIGGFTGLLTVVCDGKEYSISFDLGRVVAATSPLASDAAVRVALTNHLVSSSQVADINRRIAAAKDRDELDVLAEIAQLGPEHVDKLRRKLVAQRAARTFSLEQGTFAAEERIAMPPGADLDVREVIYLGARMNLTEQRLAGALRSFGAVFAIKPEALPLLEQFGFGTEENPVVKHLLEGASLPELEAAHRDLDPRMVQAIVYALMACGACHAERSTRAASPVVEYTDGPEVTPRASPVTEGAYFVSRTQTNPAITRTPTHPEPSAEPAPGDGDAPAVTRTASNRPPPPRSFEIPTSLPTPRPARAGTEMGGTTSRAPAPPAVDESVPRIPPRRTPTESPATARTVTGQPTAPRAPTGNLGAPRRPGPTAQPPNVPRTSTEDPAEARTSTGEVIGERPDAFDATGFRSEPVPARTATPRPGAGMPGVRAPGQPTIPRAKRGSTPAMPRTKSSELAKARTQTSDADRAAGTPPATGRTPTGQPVSSRTQTSDPAVARTASGRPVMARTSTARKTQALIAARMILVEQGADHFTLLGVPFDAPIDLVQTTYLNLVRQLHPDKLEELGVPDAAGQAQRLFHQLGVAFTVLTDLTRRAAYLAELDRPPAGIELTARTRTSDDIPAGPAGDAYRRGESALRRDVPAEAVIEFGRACALDPNNVDFHAMLGWAQFCAARDKETIAPETRKALERAIQRSPKPVHARFLLGRVERMLGRDREALRHFHEVIEATPSHAEAAAEIRAIDARIAKASKR